MEPSHEKSTLKPQLSANVIAALQKGNKIEAIKIVRQEQRLDLKDAKDLVERYVQSEPALQAPLAAAASDARNKALQWFLILLALVLVGYYFLRRT
jgi:ribosomal protein L7/L12